MEIIYLFRTLTERQISVDVAKQTQNSELLHENEKWGDNDQDWQQIWCGFHVAPCLQIYRKQENNTAHNMNQYLKQENLLKFWVDQSPEALWHFDVGQGGYDQRCMHKDITKHRLIAF